MSNVVHSRFLPTAIRFLCRLRKPILLLLVLPSLVSSVSVRGSPPVSVVIMMPSASSACSFLADCTGTFSSSSSLEAALLCFFLGVPRFCFLSLFLDFASSLLDSLGCPLCHWILHPLYSRMRVNHHLCFCLLHPPPRPLFTMTLMMFRC